MAGVDPESVIRSLQTLTWHDVEGHQGSRERLIEEARRLVERLETPLETMLRMTSAQDNIAAACRVVRDIGLWEAWREAGGEEAAIQELAQMSKTFCDLVLLRRFFRLLAAEHIVMEVGVDRYRATPLSLALGDDSSPAAQALYLWNLPNFLARTAYAEPSDPLESNFMDMTPERYNLFQRLQAHPAMGKSCGIFIAGLTDMHADWTEVYDTNELVRAFDSSGDGVLLVDMGGGRGRDASRLLAKHPAIPPSCVVLQELSGVVNSLDLNTLPAIQIMEHDFFRPQPIKAARAYFIHSCLHDYDDLDARRILNRVAAAARKAYSKLLIYDVLIPPINATRYQAICDVTLMHLASVRERNEVQWVTLLESSGFDVVKIWSHPLSPASVIEAELA